MKIEDLLWLSRYMRDNEKCATSLTPDKTGLTGTKFSKLKSAGINDFEGLEKYNNTKVKYEATFFKLILLYKANACIFLVHHVYFHIEWLQGKCHYKLSLQSIIHDYLYMYLHSCVWIYLKSTLYRLYSWCVCVFLIVVKIVEWIFPCWQDMPN
jgi:hypothetical protein